jgi:hypothetical protein
MSLGPNLQILCHLLDKTGTRESHSLQSGGVIFTITIRLK